MFELHCPNCGWTATMTPEAQAAAVAEADKLEATHHIEHCPRCQWVMRVPVADLRVAPGPVPTEVPVLLTAPEAPLLLEAEKPAEKRPAAKKPVAKKKPAAKRATAKKPAAKKPVAKKPAAKKPATKKSTAKK